MPCLGILPLSLGGQRSHTYLISFNKKAGVRLSLEKQSSLSHLHAYKYVEAYLQSLVTTNVFLGLRTFHLELPQNGQRLPAMLAVRHRYVCVHVITEA